MNNKQKNVRSFTLKILKREQQGNLFRPKTTKMKDFINARQNIKLTVRLGNE